MAARARTAQRFLRHCLWWSGLAVVVLFLLLATAAGNIAVLVSTLPATNGAGGWSWVVILLGGPLSMVLALAAHEGGHLLAARSAGLRPLFARLGPVTFMRDGEGWGCRWDRKAGWAGGLAGCDLSKATRPRVLLFLAGGPLSNLALAPAAAALALCCPEKGVIMCWAGLLAVQSSILGLLCLVPMEERRLASDGLAFWRVLTAAGDWRIAVELRGATGERRLPFPPITSVVTRSPY